MKNLVLICTLSFSLSAAAGVLYPLHSHNDYTRANPLKDAVNNNFQSIEVDVWNKGKGIKIGHNPWENSGTVEGMYLDPISEMIEKGTSLYTEEAPLLLWIDIKAFRGSIVDKLAKLIARYPMIGKQVKVIITGRKKFKKKLIQKYPELPVEIDSNDFPAEEAGPKWYTLKWSKHTSWDGKGEIPQVEFERLKLLVDTIHSEGSKLRFYGTPDSEGYWRLMNKLNVDLVNSDQTKTLKDFWEGLFPTKGHLD